MTFWITAAEEFRANHLVSCKLITFLRCFVLVNERLCLTMALGNWTSQGWACVCLTKHKDKAHRHNPKTTLINVSKLHFSGLKVAGLPCKLRIVSCYDVSSCIRGTVDTFTALLRWLATSIGNNVFWRCLINNADTRLSLMHTCCCSPYCFFLSK